MKRALRFALPHALLVPAGFFIGLVLGALEASGGWASWLADARASAGSSGAGPGHAAGAALVLLAAVIALFAVAIPASITLAGLKVGLMAAAYGFVLSCLLDWLWLFKRRLAARDVESVKRWAGRGALCISVFCAWIALFNPFSLVAGVFAVTGTFVCLGFGTIGVLCFAWARLKG